MSGSGTFAGTTYQARVIAYVYAHVLSRARLGWFRLFDDTPLAVWGETGGAGDDLRIEFGDRHRPVEVQAKHGLTGGAKLLEAVRSVHERSGAQTMNVVLAVDRKTSKTVHQVFAADLDRLQSGRTDDLGKEIERIRTELGADAGVLQRIVVVPLDVDEPTDFEAKIALHNLESILDDPTQTGAALAILIADANDLCRKRLRRTRKELVDLLAAEKITTRLPGADDHFMRQLDLSKRLLAATKPSAVLSVLGILDADTRERDVDPIIRYRSAQHRAVALLMVGRPAEALAAARLALDLQPTGIPGLLVAANAAAELRELALAASYAARVLELEPENADAWGAKAQIDVLAGAAVVAPPPGVAESVAYQMALAQIALNARDWTSLDAITGALLTRGQREPMLLLLRAQALAGLSEADASVARVVRLADAERLATEALDALDGDSPLRSKVLVARADAYRQRGETEAAEQDLAAAVTSHGDPDAIAHLALLQIHSGRPDYALQTLRIAATETFPMLLILRAEARAASGDPEGARRDLDKAIRRAEEAPEPDSLRMFGADLGLTLNDTDLAERLLDAVTTPIAPEMQATLRGRIAFKRKDAATMRERFEEAVRIAPAIRPQLFAELAQRLLRLSQAAAAVDVFAAVGSDALPEGARQAFAAALMETSDLVTAAKLVEDVSRSGEPPEWALSVQVEIATRQGDAEKAIALLQEIARRRPDDHGLAFEVAQRLVGMGQCEAAAPYLEQLLAAKRSFEPRQQIDLAHVLKAAGRIDEAITLAFAAIRQAPQDPAIHRGFGSLLATDAPPIMHSGTVTDETYVRLESEGSSREYVVYRDGPIDPLRKELSLGEAAKLGLEGKRVGDTVEATGTWPLRTWTIVEILPAVVYVFRDVMARYEERFPGEPFFVHMVQMSNEDSVAYLTPIISTLQKRKERAYAIFKAYGETTLPLGVLARLLGVGIPEVMHGAISDEPRLGPLRVEWFDAEGQEESAAVANSAHDVVVTRSALETLADLGILDLVITAHRWFAPQSLLDALRRELAEADERVTSGQHSMMASETGIRIVAIEEGDASLTARADHVRVILTWVSQHAKVELRPLETIKAPTADEEEVRTSIGADSIDAVQLTEHLGVALLADDLGLRRFLPKGSKGRSFSTVALLPALAAKGILDETRVHELLLRLVERNYVAISPTSALLITSLRQKHSVTPLVGRAFGLLAGQALDISSAVQIAAETVKAALLLPLQVADAARLTTLVLDALSTRWPPRIAAYHFLKMAATELALMPEHLASIQATALAYVRART